MRQKLLLLLSMLIISLGASAQNFRYKYEGQTLTYTVIDHEARTCMIKDGPRGYSSNENQVSGILVIPPYAWFNNVQYSVVAIGKQSFEATGIVQVTIPESVTSIGNRAFAGSHQLKSITIPAGVTSMGQQVFADCLGLAEIKVEYGNKNYTSLDGVLCNYEKTEIIKCPPAKTGSFHIPESATTVDENAFQGCTELTDVTIPESVTSIGKRAFERCYGLHDVTLNSSITSFGEFAFSGSSIGTVTLPESLTSISKGAFNGCSNLREIKIPDSVTRIGDFAFTVCRSLTTVTMGKSVNLIGSHAFENCNALSDITLPESLSSIGECAFYDTAIESVNLSDNITYIARSTFDRCSSLKTVIIGNSVKTVAAQAFSGCVSLTSLTLGSSIITIDMGAFGNCSSLTSVTFPESLNRINHAAFSCCSSLTSVTIPAFVKSLGENVFVGCDNLTAINVDPANGHYASVDGVLFNKEITELMQYPASKPGSCVVPETVTKICENAFAYSKALTSVTIPKSVTSIGQSALYGCSDTKAIYVDSGNPRYASANGVLFTKDMTVLLQYPGGKTGAYEIPGTVEYIAGGSFSRSENLTGVTIPQSVSYIERDAFWECPILIEVNYPAYEPVDIWGGGGFDQHTCDNAILYVRKEALDKIMETSPWKNFKNIKTKEFDVEVEEVAADTDSSQPVSVYTLNGTYVGASTADLAPGIYIVRTGVRAVKVLVR